MKQTFGCIDGTHIPIRRPLESSQEYYNYKNFFSLSVQAVCDSWTWTAAGPEAFMTQKFSLFRILVKSSEKII